ncbi:MAG TPA: PhzF family phenazine biosynthesis protein [Gemmatimonadota bacterium]|nr:PhzF family phenazine biosynthesis protein [Gemmatimonadota bacterium]
MPIPISVVDAFSERPFRGNPAGVCLPPRAMDAGWMQAVAAEMNLAETAFLRPRGSDEFDLRWFTPEVEVDLCGHATLASAHRLWEDGLAEGPIAFHTRSGILTASRNGEEIELDFPSQPPREAPAPPGLSEALGAPFLWTGTNALGDLVVQLEDERAVRDLEPDFAALGRIPARGIVVTAAADRSGSGHERRGSGHDFVSRFFAPRVGIDEDPVTGSAHCALAPFWSARLGRDELVGWQASRRGGIVRTRLAGDRVALGGRAVTVWKGELSSEAERTEAQGREAGS